MKKIIGFCFSLFVGDRWTIDGFRALRAAGFTHVRLTFNLDPFAPSTDPATWRWDILDAVVAGLRTVGIEIYLNPDGCPRWASGGQPAWGDALISRVWWNDPQHPDVNQLHRFDQDPATNPQYAAIDQREAPRPWLTNPPRRDPQAFFDFGAAFAAREFQAADSATMRYRDVVAFWGWENEPGANDDPVMHLDFDGPLGDTIKERFFPETAVPFFSGLFSVIPNAKTIGVDADSGAILDRCCSEEASRTDRLYTHALGAHPYGSVRSNMDYATDETFAAVFDKWALGRERWCSELAAAPDVLLAWLRRYGHLYSAIFLLGQPWMPLPGIDVTHPDVAPFVAEFTKINSPTLRRHRAVTP
jgi:hypothetical protein